MEDVPTKAVHVLGIVPEDSNASPRKPSVIPWNSPRGSLSKAKSTTTTRGGKSDSSLLRSAHRNSRYMATKTDSPDSRTSPASRPSRVDGSPVSVKSGSIRTSAVVSNATTPKRHESPAAAVRKSPTQSRSDISELSLKGKDKKDAHGNKNHYTDEKAARIKAKRSFRDFFHMRDGKRAVESEAPVESKRSSLTFGGSNLAKRFRHSANFSKPNSNTASVTIAVSPRPEPEIETRAEDEDGHVHKSEDDAQIPSPATCSDTGVIVNNIVNSVSELPSYSPDRLRGLEIAEVCKTIHIRSIMLEELVLTVRNKQALLNAADAYKQARISAAKAKKHARHAELNAERAGVELERMQTLFEPHFDHETMQAIRQLIHCVGAIGGEEQTSPPFGEAMPPSGQ